MDTPKWIAWTGLAAILGGLLAILLTAPFASAYFAGYPGIDRPPFWLPLLKPALRPLITFATPVQVYLVYGRVFDLAYLLFLPAAFGLHHLHQGSRNRIEKWGFGLLVVGLLATFVGVAGDYWADGAGFFIELVGLLVLAIGVTLYGVALLQTQVMPGGCAWLLVACGPSTLVFSLLIGHIPSGPTFPFAISWVMVGGLLLFGKGVSLARSGAAQHRVTADPFRRG